MSEQGNNKGAKGKGFKGPKGNRKGPMGISNFACLKRSQLGKEKIEMQKSPQLPPTWKGEF